MMRSITWLSFASSALAQFDYKHSQYETSPPVYPSRKLPYTKAPDYRARLTNSANITGVGGWADALGKARALLGQLTPEEKAGMVTGNSTP